MTLNAWEPPASCSPHEKKQQIVGLIGLTMKYTVMYGCTNIPRGYCSIWCLEFRVRSLSYNIDSELLVSYHGYRSLCKAKWIAPSTVGERNHDGLSFVAFSL